LLLLVASITTSTIAAVEFKGMTWYYSKDPTGLLFVNPEGKLQWKPVKREQLTVRIPEQRLSRVGDVVEFALKWKSNGQRGCNCANVRNFHGEFCNDDSIDCLAGTGDFRIGLFDSNGKGYVNKDNLGTDPKVFSGYLGYAWRFFPHLAPNTVRRVLEYKEDGDERESHTNMSFWERTKPEKSTLLATSSSYNRIGQPLAGGFALPLAVEGILRLKLERLSATSVKMKIELNGHSYERIAEKARHQPKKIDVFAIQFPNARPYDYIILDTIEPKPKAAFAKPSATGFQGRLPVDVPLNLSKPSDKPITLTYKLAGGTAIKGKDFQLTGNNVTFAPGETKKSIELLIKDDKIDDAGETVILELTGALNADIAGSRKYTFTINEPEGIHLKVDFGLPVWSGSDELTNSDTPVPNTVKKGWTPWVSPRWADMYDHGGVQLEDVAGTGINMSMTTVRGGHMTLKVAGLRSGLAGGFGPLGDPLYQPICNSWIYNCDWPDNPWGDIILAVYNLPAGRYLLRSYHNHFYCKRVPGTDDPTIIDCTGIKNPQPDMPSIKAMSLDELLKKYEGVERWHNARPQFVNAQPEYWDYHGQPDYPANRPLGRIGTGAVKTIKPARDVPCQQVTSDAQLIPSQMTFTTDGSAVHVVYEAGCCIADGVRRSRYEGGRAILNAFELIYLGRAQK